MKDYKKTLIAVSLSSIMAFTYANDFMAIIGIEDTVAEKVGTTYKNITPWVDEGGQYDCTTWSPETSTIDYGVLFQQSQDCSQNQTRNKDLYTVYNSGAEVFERTEKEDQTITETNTQDNTGTRNFMDHERRDPWGEWVDNGSHYDCLAWTPETSTVDYGESFTQTRDCKQDQDRYRDVYDVWADGTETYKSTESESQTIVEEESQAAVGSRNYITGTRSDSWSSWTDTGGHYSCGTWSPNVSTIDYGESFTQTRSCSQNQIRSRNVYDVWADGSETLNTVDTENRTISENENQPAIGTKNYVSGTDYGSWSSWTDTGGHYSCSSYSPSTSTVDYGDSFTQTRSCKQDQTRSRSVYDVWADGSKTYRTTETDSQTINENETRSATGSRNYITGTTTGSWGSWTDTGNHYSCGSYSPSTSTVDYGDSFTQTRSCKQDQTRSRTIYDNWADGTQTVNRTETDSRTINENETRSSTGTRNYITGTTTGSWSGWSDTGGHYDCGSYSPSTSTVNYGQSFTQTRSCKQNQTRSRTIYDDWADGSQTVNRTETGSQTINENETRSATGSKNYVTSTSTSTGSWTNSGGVYSCSSWSPSTSTVNSGTRFTQTRTCKQNQTQSVTTYNHWADGSKTVKSTSSNSRTVNVNQSQTATGTKPITGTWVRKGSSGTKYGCTGSGLSGTCSPIGATAKRWVSNGQSSGVPVCTEATYRCE